MHTMLYGVFIRAIWKLSIKDGQMLERVDVDAAWMELLMALLPPYDVW